MTSTSARPAPEITEGYPYSPPQWRAWSAMWAALGDGQEHAGPVLALVGQQAGAFQTVRGARCILQRAASLGVIERSGRPYHLDGPQRIVTFYSRGDVR